VRQLGFNVRTGDSADGDNHSRNWEKQDLTKRPNHQNKRVMTDRENSITLLWPERGSIPIPTDPHSDIQPIALKARAEENTIFCLLTTKMACVTDLAKRTITSVFIYVESFLVQGFTGMTKHVPSTSLLKLQHS
jgi:hypothetical protein